MSTTGATLPSSTSAVFNVLSATGSGTSQPVGATPSPFTVSSLVDAGFYDGNSNRLFPGITPQTDFGGIAVSSAQLSQSFRFYVSNNNYHLDVQDDPNAGFTPITPAQSATLISCATSSSSVSSVSSSRQWSSAVSSSAQSSSAMSSSAFSSSPASSSVYSSSAQSSSVFSSSPVSSSVSSSPPSSSVYSSSSAQSSSVYSSSVPSSSVYSSSVPSSSAYLVVRHVLLGLLLIGRVVLPPPSQPPSSTSSASAYSDPRFVGFWGQQWYVEGEVGGGVQPLI